MYYKPLNSKDPDLHVIFFDTEAIIGKNLPVWV